jgi:hypothetical protein
VRALIPVLAYFSPETLLPVRSIVATIAGIVMMLGRGTLGLIARSARRRLRRPGRVASTSKPHLPITEAVPIESPGR